MKRRHWFILLGVLLFAGYALGQLTASLQPYVSVAEAQKSSRSVQVKGKLEKTADSLYEDEQQQLHFVLQDEQGDCLPVSYRGEVPENFMQATDLVVIGKYQSGSFQAEKVLAKCPSKYQKNS